MKMEVGQTNRGETEAIYMYHKGRENNVLGAPSSTSLDILSISVQIRILGEKIDYSKKCYMKQMLMTKM